MKKKLTLFEVQGEHFPTLDDACRHVYREAGFGKEWLDGLSELANGYTAVKGNPKLPREFSLRDKMPPVYNQASRGTCVANAVAALMEYYEGTGTRLSVQYLFEYMKRDERADYQKAALELANGQQISDPDIRVMAEEIRDDLYNAACARVQENGGAPSVAVPTDKQLAGVLYTHVVERSDGSRLRYPFRVLRDHGICTYDVWPYDRRQLEHLSRVDDANVQHLPPGADEDAFRHRLNEQVYLFASPNNVEEIRNYIGGLRYAPMPVCIGATVFDGPDGGGVQLENGFLRIPKFTPVEIVRADYECEVDLVRHTFCNPVCVEGTRTVAKTVNVPDSKISGGHAMVLVGYCDDEAVPGGGYFTVRNSWGEDWGEGGYAKMPYAYVELFVHDAATILRPKAADAAPASPAVDRDADLAPYLVVADRDMKDRRGCYRIKKGQKVLVDDEGRADVYSELNARVFRRNGYVWKV